MIDIETNKLLKEWLNDLKTAEQLLISPEDEIIANGLCFHCQQAVEDFLKAFLVHRKKDLHKFHKLEYLIKLCTNIDKDFEFLFLMNLDLTTDATEVRYQDEFYSPSLDEAKSAFVAAQQSKELIFGKSKVYGKDL
ncbi:MAG: HEPN domain-containing protein [Ignavibacteria bacterium]|nr:HEPN domain-containing protein [Ignavibacteria bacterium]